MLVFVVVRVTKDFERLAIALHAAAVLRRARTFAGKAQGPAGITPSDADVLDEHLVPPGITQVVLVDERLTLFARDPLQTDTALILHRDLPLGTGIRVKHTTRGEGMQVGVRPSHGRLDDAVEPPKSHALVGKPFEQGRWKVLPPFRISRRT